MEGDVPERQDRKFPLPGERAIWRALDRVPKRQRAAVVLRYAEDRSERETADLLRCSVPAVKSLTARALDTLRAELRGDDG